MKRLEIRLLGGFEAKLTGRPVQRFESQKVRALLGYLALHSDQALNRDHLAGLFWPERPDDVARRNLRQALYNIRRAMSNETDGVDALEANQNEVRLHPDLDCWVDIDEFRQRVKRGLGKAGPDPLELTEAVRLYKGDLLAGLFLRGCVEFEEWLITHQERDRELALQAFRTLVQIYLARGEHRFGIQYAKRLLAIDPLSEETHRQLMRLYLMAGRRNRALSQYEQLLNLLQSELGVDPVEETTELYRSVLLQGEPDQETEDEDDSSPPIIPLIGRGSHFELLQEEWNSVLDGDGRFTRVTGESGVGKSRLVKSFIDGASSKRNTAVLRGRSYESAPVVGYRAIAEAVRAVFTDHLADEPERATSLGADLVADLALLCPELPKLTATTLDLDIDLKLADPERAAQSFVDLLDTLQISRPSGARPVIFLIEDVHWADDGSLLILEHLLRNLEGRSIWVIATSTAPGRTDNLAAAAGGAYGAVPIQRLGTEQVEEIAKSLVDLASAPVLADYLWRTGQGLPLAVAELVNLLWDEKILIQLAPGRWALRADPGEIDPPDAIDELIHRRFASLPNSSRRLMALAAVLGEQFDVELLTQAADEHLGVVEIAVQLSLERWLIRQFPRSWSQGGQQRDIVLWARGARRGFFEFSHRAIRTAILEKVNPLRKRVMHAEVASALAKHNADDTEFVSEELAFHWLEAGEAEMALPWLEHSAQKAAAAGIPSVQKYYSGQAKAIKKTLEKNSRKGGRVVSMRRKAPPEK